MQKYFVIRRLCFLKNIFILFINTSFQNYTLACSTSNCSICMNDSCTQCNTVYYLYENTSCLLDCLTNEGFYSMSDFNNNLYCKSNFKKKFFYTK